MMFNLITCFTGMFDVSIKKAKAQNKACLFSMFLFEKYCSCFTVYIDKANFILHQKNFLGGWPQALVVGDTGQNGFDPIPINISPYREYRYSFNTIFRPHI